MHESTTVILQKSRLCKGLTKEEIIEIQKDRFTEIKVYDKGNLIFDQNDMPSKIYVLLSGGVSISKNTFSGKRILITTIEHPGEIFGEVYLFMERPVYDMQAEATEKSVILELQNEVFRESSHNNSDIDVRLRNNMMSIFAMKAYTLSSKVRVLGCASIREKIATYLIEHQDKSGNIIGKPSREELADYLNVARPSLSRELGNMAHEGILKMEGRKIIILDQEMLEEFL